MKFRYVYQKVVDLKSNEKTQAEWMLSAAIGQLQSEQRSLEQLLEEKANTAAVIAAEAESTASMIKLQELQRYMDFLDQAIERKLADIRAAEVNVEHKKTILKGKMLDEKVWLKAKEKAMDKFRHEMLLREQNELDEMATVRFAMRAR
ncbi:flagellar export protein FliJ [Paenibacillus phoenicis]|jgi:flagellar FliJ protein|uniref:Flagellar FliJ protein n=2 Tax=Paenibacillus TaxID=44249 RepID=A0ABY1LYW5_9BACL|nr:MULTISPECIES: flagellar export protein FliJ [Paenibacillus]MCT2196721.1 flagellar export protein FliJ [Paenibacillus sp. p3-SID1389]MDU0331380.1 flagellar export protein FliJ [Paenibacillus sp. 3LSP]MEA3569271.1 flagellar export protein FliJ [Paenibacillus phoenicis]MEC2346049.1 flagellar export protein FliJ [Paenibacillus barengoltzii]SME93571.1 flagellar FliJ protein [Paenibacillus barengoltzii]